MLQRTRYHQTRFWALWDGNEINYHPQSGWFEDAPLKGGTDVQTGAQAPQQVLSVALSVGH